MEKRKKSGPREAESRERSRCGRKERQTYQEFKTVARCISRGSYTNNDDSKILLFGLLKTKNLCTLFCDLNESTHNDARKIIS